jgi:DNA end-binding protein Ku
VARALWKGSLKIGELRCAVALHGAASTAERITLNTVNRATGHRVRRIYVDPVSGREVPREDQVKGYGEEGDEVVLEPEAVASAIPENHKTLTVDAFIPCDEIDTLYFDKPYYLRPADAAAREAFALVREGLRAEGAAALARALLFRRLRTVLIRAHGTGLIATTLNFDYAVRPPVEVFGDIAPRKIGKDMLDLAKHIIATKTGRFDPAQFTDRYEAALKAVIQAKIAGEALPAPAKPTAAPVIDLMTALKRSAAAAKPAKQKKSRKAG